MNHCETKENCVLGELFEDLPLLDVAGLRRIALKSTPKHWPTDEELTQFKNAFSLYSHSIFCELDTRSRGLTAIAEVMFRLILENLKPGREKQLALTKLEETMMWVYSA